MTRVRSVVFFALVGMTIACIASAAEPRGRPGRRPGGGMFGGISRLSNAMLLRVDQVRTELKVTDEQKKQLDAYFEESQGGGSGMRELVEKVREKLEGLSEEDRRDALRAEFQKIRDQRTKPATEALSKILTEKQLARLAGIRLQLQGFGALGDSDIIGKLGITREQGGKMKALRDEMQQETQGLFRELGRGGSREERMKAMQGIGEKMRGIQKATLDKAIETVLTTAQKDTLKELMGEPFELDLQELSRAFMGRGGPGGVRRTGRGRPQE